jgi:hypothetical protein
MLFRLMPFTTSIHNCAGDSRILPSGQGLPSFPTAAAFGARNFGWLARVAGDVQDQFGQSYAGGTST